MTQLITVGRHMSAQESAHILMEHGVDHDFLAEVIFAIEELVCNYEFTQRIRDKMDSILEKA